MWYELSKATLSSYWVLYNATGEKIKEELVATSGSRFRVQGSRFNARTGSNRSSRCNGSNRSRSTAVYCLGNPYSPDPEDEIDSTANPLTLNVKLRTLSWNFEPLHASERLNVERPEPVHLPDKTKADGGLGSPAPER